MLQRDRPLSDLERDRFEDLLRQLTVERAAICEAMVFALDNADAAGEVVDILAQSMSLAETPVPLKVARLFLASDILHNSTAPGGYCTAATSRWGDLLLMAWLVYAAQQHRARWGWRWRAG